MRKLLFLLLTVISVSVSAQYQPSGSKVRYVNGVAFGTKSDAAFGTVDSLVLYAKADSTLMFKYKGTARALAYASQLPNDSLGVLVRLKAGTSGGIGVYANNWTQIAQLGAGGSSAATFYGFAGYNSNVGSGYTARSFTDKNFVDSSRALDVQLAGTQTITGAKTFSAILNTGSRLNVNGATDNASYALNVTGVGNFSSQLNGTRVVMNNSSQTQGELWGWNSIQGASANAGEIRLGGTESIQGRLIFTSSGNTGVYIDNTFDDAAAEIRLRTRVAGTAVNTIIASANGVTLASLGTGTVYSNSGLLTNTNPSDSTIKNTIKPLGYGLSEVLRLQPKTFYYNSDSTKTSLKYGFIAQEVQKIMPDMVRKFNVSQTKDSSGVKVTKQIEKLGLETDGIYVTLVKAIQEQQAIIDDLKKRIAALENK